jgi:hypothetical protein
MSHFVWTTKKHVTRAAAAYAQIMEAMAGVPIPCPPLTAIHGRFHSSPLASPLLLADCAAAHITAHALPRQVFLFADSHRPAITARMEALGIAVVQPLSPPLTVDLDRRPEDMMTYLVDWKTLRDARIVKQDLDYSCSAAS